LIMARMHSKRGGKSGSKRPATKAVPEWVEYSAPEVEDLILGMGKKGMAPALIGQTLRDQHGVPSTKALTGKSVEKILKEGGVKMAYPPDLLELIKRAMNVRAHLKVNTSDVHNRVKLGHIEMKIKRLARFYTSNGKLPEGWKYDPETAALLVK